MTLQACISILLCRSSQALSGWMGNAAAQLFSSFSKDDGSGSSLGSESATQGHSKTSSKATPALSWLCAQGRCPVGRWTFAPVWGPERSGAGLSSRISLYFVPFIFPSILTSLPVPAAEKHPHSMMLPPPCFTVGMVSGFLQTWRLAFRPKSSIKPRPFSTNGSVWPGDQL